MKYNELETLIGDIYNIKCVIEGLNDNLNRLSDTKERKCNMITLGGKDYYMKSDHELTKDFSKSIYESLVTYYKTIRESYYESYEDKMNELKSVCDNNNTIDFGDTIAELMIK